MDTNRCTLHRKVRTDFISLINFIRVITFSFSLNFENNIIYIRSMFEMKFEFLADMSFKYRNY